MNKYNVDAVIWDGAVAVGSYTVSFAYSNTDTRPGKINGSAAFSATASKDPNRYNSEGSEHITCLEDLHDFDSVVSIEVYEDIYFDCQLVPARILFDQS